MFYLFYITSFFVIIPLITAFGKRKQFNSIFFPVFYLLLFSLITETSSAILAIKNINTMFIFNGFTIIEFTLLSLFYIRFFEEFFRPWLIYVFVIFYIALVVYLAFFNHSVTLMNGLSLSVESVIMIGYALLAFYLIMKNLLFENLFNTPFFWMNTAILMYFSGNLFFFVFSTYLQKHDHKDFSIFLSFHAVLNALFYIFLTIGFWKIKKK